jgi:NAD-dependent dihydropyrimidine dehydrogenase PreA subunit
MKIKRKIIEIDDERCDGCGQCVPGCAEGALKIVDGKARMIAENLCDGLGACIGECPNDALTIIEREAQEFDEIAVEEHLKKQENRNKAELMPCGCPSTNIQDFTSQKACDKANQPARIAAGPLALTHWPIQIRLIPPEAPFLKEADLLVVADCVPAAYPNFHRDLLDGKKVALGCPKFDNPQEYIDKFAAIFKVAGIKSITTVVMEVPCCSGLPMIVRKGLEAAGMDIPIKTIVVDTRGQILSS